MSGEEAGLPEEVVGLSEAARLTGWSVKTLRRRCVKGEIAGARTEQVGQGVPEWRIPVGSLPHRQGTDNAQSGQAVRGQVLEAMPRGQSGGDGVAALAAVIADLTARLSEAQGQVARLTGEAAEARGQVLQLQARSGGSLLEALRKRLGGSSS
jgi:hypothetical protein